MLTIRPLCRRCTGWQLPVVDSCGNPFRDRHRLFAIRGGLIAVLLICLSSSAARAQDPSEFDGPAADPATERMSDPSRRQLTADPSVDSVKIVSHKMSIDLTQNSSKVFEFRDRLLSVDGHDAQLIDIQPLDPNRLRVRGLGQGVTTMIVTDETKQKFTIDVYVGGDARELQAVLKRAFKDSAIQCQALKNDTVLLTGFVTDNQTIAQIMEVARTYAANVINHMRVGGPQEVQLRVKIIEVQRSKLRTFGINFQSFTSNSVISSTPGPITPVSAFTNGIGASPTLTLTPTSSNSPSLTAGISGNHFAFEIFLQALKEEGLLKVYTEPILVTRSGEASRLSDGGEFPIPVPGGLGTVTIEFREFGVILESLPLVISPTKVKLQVSAEVSEKDVSNAITLNGTTVPGITKRKVQSVVDMNFGHTMVIGGLILTRDVGNSYKTPFLGELPGIGMAFRKMVYQRSETETIVLITPEFGSSIPSGQVPPGGPGLNTVEPTDRELYIGGFMETPKYGPECGPDCRSNWPTKSNGDCYPNSPPADDPTLNSAPMNGPIPSGLIAPPGARPTSSVPSAPSTGDGVSKKSSTGTNWLAKSRTTVSPKPKDTKMTKDSDSVRPAGFKRPQNIDQENDRSRSLDTKEAP